MNIDLYDLYRRKRERDNTPPKPPKSIAFEVIGGIIFMVIFAVAFYMIFAIGSTYF
jgi:hypothetical protein